MYLIGRQISNFRFCWGIEGKLWYLMEDSLKPHQDTHLVFYFSKYETLYNKYNWTFFVIAPLD